MTPSTSEDELLRYKKAAFAAMVLKQGIYRDFTQWFSDRIGLIVEFIEKDYTSYADAAFLYTLKVDDNPNLLETIKNANPKLKNVAMSVAEKLIQEGIQIGEEKGKLEGKLEGKKCKALSIAKAMLLKGYSTEEITILTGLSKSDIQSIM